MSGIRDTALMKALAVEMKARRATLKISQEELAHRAGVGPLFIARLETARNQPSISSFVLIAQALELKPATFMSTVMARYTKEQSVAGTAG